MTLSVCFIITDILAVTHVIQGKGLPDGINPFWKLAFVFKCLTDTIVLDDFKTALDRLKQYKLERMGSVVSDGVRGEFADFRDARRKKFDEESDLRPGQHIPDVRVRDWTKLQDCEHVDLESALRMGSVQRGESARSSGG